MKYRLLKYTIPVILPFLLTLATACVPDVEQGKFPTQTQDSLPNEPQDPQGTKIGEGSGAGTMTGTWLLGTLNSSCVFGQENVAVNYQLVNIEQTGVELTEKRTFCQFEISPLLGVKPIISKEVLDSGKQYYIGKGFVSGQNVKAGYSSPTLVVLHGMELSDPLNEEMPSETSDPRIIDSDNDGKPGASFGLEGKTCKRQTVQRQTTRFMGTFRTPNLIRGKTIDRTEIFIIPSGDFLCDSSAEATPNDQHSEFSMGRIDGKGGAPNADKNDDGQITCEEAEPFFVQVMQPREPNHDHCG